MKLLTELTPRLGRFLSDDLTKSISEGEPKARDIEEAIRRLNTLRVTLSNYLPEPLVEAILDTTTGHGIPTCKMHGERKTGTIIFTDVSGFTAMAERLKEKKEEGAEILTDNMNEYFTEMLDCLAKSGGMLLKFAGDALLAYFQEQEGREGEDVAMAVRAALRMQRAMPRFTRDMDLRMKVGVERGDFLGAIVFTPLHTPFRLPGQPHLIDYSLPLKDVPRRTEYMVTCGCVQGAMEAEGNAVAPQIMLGPQARRYAEEYFKKEGWFELKESKAEGYASIEYDEGIDLDDYEITPIAQRRRTSVPMSRNLDALVGTLADTLPFVEALAPCVSPDLLDRIISRRGRAALTGEHRLTVIMFCNFRGPEPLLDILEDRGEAITIMTYWLQQAFSAIEGAVDTCGGIVTRTDPYSHGSKVLAIFGAPVARENDLQRTAAAALMICRRIEEIHRLFVQAMTKIVPDEHKEKLKEMIVIGIGITRGITFASEVGDVKGRREYTVMGHEVNLAARLMSVAAGFAAEAARLASDSKPGVVITHAPVRDGIVNDFVCTPREPVRVKNVSQPVEIFEVEKEKHGRPGLSRDVPMVGREKELEQVLSVLGESSAEKKGKVILLEGETGIGKSHLATVAADTALGQGFTIYWGQCMAHHVNTGYYPWKAVLYEGLQIDREAPPQIQRQQLNDALQKMGMERSAMALDQLIIPRPVQVARFTPAEPEPLPREMSLSDSGVFRLTGEKKQPTTQAAGVGGMFERLAQKSYSSTLTGLWKDVRARIEGSTVVRQWLLKQSGEAPVLIVMEDMQWIDDESWKLVKDLAQEAVYRPITIVLTRRTEGQAADGEAREMETDLRMTLGELGREDTALVACNLLKANSISEKLLDWLYENGRGLPLFINTLTNSLMREQAVYVDDDGVAHRARELTYIPDTLEEVILSRIDRLNQELRMTLQYASVLGESFTFRQLEAINPWRTDRIGKEQISERLKSNLDGLVEESILYQGESGTYTFLHGLTQETAYKSMAHRLRRNLHKDIADHMVEMGEYSLDTLLSIVNHYSAAQESDKAIHYAMRGAEACLEQEDRKRGRTFYQIALEQLPADGSKADLRAEIEEVLEELKG